MIPRIVRSVVGTTHHLHQPTNITKQDTHEEALYKEEEEEEEAYDEEDEDEEIKEEEAYHEDGEDEDYHDQPVKEQQERNALWEEATALTIQAMMNQALAAYHCRPLAGVLLRPPQRPKGTSPAAWGRCRTSHSSRI